MNRNELISENEKLLKRRAALPTQKPTPSPDLVKAPPRENDSDTLSAPIAANTVRIDGDRTRWDAFDWSLDVALVEAKPIIVDWYNNLPDSGALILSGNTGVGKSHIASALRDLYGAWRVALIGETRMIKRIQASYSGGSGESEEAIMHSLLFQSPLSLGETKTDRVFMLDDLGVYESNNVEWVRNIYRRIFEDYLGRGKPLLITSNLPLFADDDGDSIEARIGARSFSRLVGALGNARDYVDLFDVADRRIEDFING